jgi:hypothetical protein
MLEAEAGVTSRRCAMAFVFAASVPWRDCSA